MALLDQIKKIYGDNHRVGEFRGVHYDYTCPSPKFYPHQWLWDSCFHAVVLTYVDIERAKREIHTLLSKQREDGFIPCVSFWQEINPILKLFYAEKITQPPVIPAVVEILYNKSLDLNFLKEVYPKLRKFFDWLPVHRDKNNNNLLEVIHPWEAGCDTIPSFDGQLGIRNPKPSVIETYFALIKMLVKYYLLGWDENKIYKSRTFIAESVLFNSIYAQSLASMARLAKIVGESSEAAIFEDRYKKTIEALINLSWSDKDQIFYDLDKDGMQVKVKTTSSLMPIIINDLPEKYVKSLIEKHLLNKNEFWPEYPIPSVAMTEATFDPRENFVLSRGPVWSNTNWFLSKALAHWGYNGEAKEISDKMVRMIEKSGFREYYNPLTGDGYGQRNFTWPGLVLDM